ncbi:MAG: histidinol-phosphatase HisJ family protein [Oscillospiraceae bacterium]
MILTDFHIHSKCSCDGYHTMLEMARAARERGVEILCFTDHCDMDNSETGEPDPNYFNNRDSILEMYRQTLTQKPENMKIFLGLELGEGNHNPEKAALAAAIPELDFVLGSLHNLKKTPDFYVYPYSSEAECRLLINRYLDELIELSKLDFYDVMAHIGYTVRYMRRKGFDIWVSAEEYPEKIRTLLKCLIERGKGIEINCAGFRDKIVGGPIPTIDVLKLYRELGGEIITVGSDAHKLQHAGVGLKEGFDILSDLGYKYVTFFEKRKPSFIKI